MGKKDRYETKRSGCAWWGKTKARTIKDIRTESWRCTMEHSQPFQVETKVNYSSCNSCNHGRTFRSCDDDNYVPFDGKKCFESSKLFSLSNSNQTNKNRFLYSTFLLACLSSGIAQVVEGADIGEISRVQLWPGEDSGRTTTLFTRVNLVPKCTDDSQCTGEQICHFPVTGKQLLSGFHLTDRPLVGECRCPLGSVLWKWRCYLSVPKLGGHCVVTRQCQTEQDPRRHCNPITRRCDCEPGHLEVRRRCVNVDATTTTAAMSLDFFLNVTSEGTASSAVEDSSLSTSTTTAITNDTGHHEMVEKVLNATLMKSWGEREGRSYASNGTMRAPGLFQWDSYRINTVAYIGLALLCVILVGVVSAFYARMVKDKRRSRAAIRSLLDLMSENRSMQSVYTMDSNNAPYNPNHTNNNNSSNSNGNSRSNNPADDFVDPDCSSSSGDSLTYCDSLNCTRRSFGGPVMEDRIHLPPIDDPKYPKLPSPHLSAPVLPPIRRPVNENRINSGISRPRPVPASKLIDGVDSRSGKSPSPDAISAISQNLSESGNFKPIISAASFPDEDPMHIEPDKFRINPDIIRNEANNLWIEADKLQRESLKKIPETPELDLEAVQTEDQVQISAKTKLDTELILKNTGNDYSDNVATFM